MTKITEWWNKLKGYKTYGLAVIAGLALLAYSLGWIDGKSLEVILGICGVAIPMSLRSAINNITK
jgi:hypothetical protein